MIVLALGSNIEPRKKHLCNAIELLRKNGVEPVSVSGVYETEPRDYLDQDTFYNMVIEVKTELLPEDLLLLNQKLEKDLKRRKIINKGPRTIDIDIIAYDDVIKNEENLTLPHYAYKKRNFVLIPLKEAVPDFQDPVTGEKLSDIMKSCDDQGKVQRIGNLDEI